ncbi:DUF5412 family protein [Paenibacillus xylanexedens]|uniref:DUF5412 family protein n=1 Tax=Paenibacillus xylanexedens TaxID=528191 RepID=UPI0011A4543D|nr:DUF5412 family protein [Paenibacillus xylanexedens]
MRKLSWVDLFLVLFLYFISIYSLYSHMNNKWLVSPPNYVILILSILGLALAILGFKDTSNKSTKVRSWISTVLSVVLIFILLGALSFTSIFSGSKQLLTTTHSPDKHNTISFYKTDAGAMGSFGVVGELKGPLWFKRVFYYEGKTDQVDLEWVDNHTISINDQKVNVSSGEMVRRSP